MSDKAGCDEVFGYQCKKELKHLVSKGLLKGVRIPPYFVPNYEMICGADGLCPSCVAKLEADLKAYRALYEAVKDARLNAATLQEYYEPFPVLFGKRVVEALSAIEQREGG